ncbi:alpha/beta hydrolase family protein [Aspergillus lucknowensis]|uniref:Alpha/Beta hydrolase protein n=1 Tax=Aspergillus lucknowensis TaxID=176173 RepID=A0ABR4LZ27_9EURO
MLFSKMKLPSALLLAAATLASAQPTKRAGPYPSNYYTEDGLADHTIYFPDAPPDNTSLPILIWGNGACGFDGTAFANFLTNIASYGFLVIASGVPGGQGSTTSQLMRDAIDWAVGVAGTGNYAGVDTENIAVAGQSCGGLEAYQLRDDERVTGLGIFNSGFVAGMGDDPSAISEVTKPTFYFLGGSSDIAYENGMRDYQALTGVPKWVGNYPVGHGGTYSDVDGGAFGEAAVNWLQWLLKGDTTAAEFFTGGGAEAAGWQETASEGLEGLGA